MFLDANFHKNVIFYIFGDLQVNKLQYFNISIHKYVFDILRKGRAEVGR